MTDPSRLAAMSRSERTSFTLGQAEQCLRNIVTRETDYARAREWAAEGLAAIDLLDQVNRAEVIS